MYKNSSIMAFIPAKTNSQGLPGKMFKKIGNYTLFEWTLLAAHKSEYIDEIVVSSNDAQIEDAIVSFSRHILTQLNIKNKKVQFVRRPDELCTATSKTEHAISHFFNEYYSYRQYDYMVLMQATSPIRWKNLTDNCIMSCVGLHDSLITVEKHTPFFWRKNSETSTVYPTYSLKNRPMRQEIQDDEYFYKDNGNIYITRVPKYIENKIRVSDDVFLYVTDTFASMQIDYNDDLDIMRCVHEKFGDFV